MWKTQNRKMDTKTLKIQSWKISAKNYYKAEGKKVKIKVEHNHVYWSIISCVSGYQFVIIDRLQNSKNSTSIFRQWIKLNDQSFWPIIMDLFSSIVIGISAKSSCNFFAPA